MPTNPQDKSYSNKKLAFSYISLIHEPQTRTKLRNFLMWDILFSMVIKPEYREHKFNFDNSDPLWGTFAWNLKEMKKEMNNDAKYNAYIEQVITEYAPPQIGAYASPEEIRKIFKWLNEK